MQPKAWRRGAAPPKNDLPLVKWGPGPLPDSYKPGPHARQIAGLLNAARGRPAMWIIGAFDEDAHELGFPR